MATATEPRAGAIPLDEVMLAMDVVDTLRHERTLVEEALGEEARARELIARVQDIYASQGIEVPADVIAEGVEALRRDRFKYVPPERTLQVRLAEIYVERGKWAKRLAIVVAIALAAWVAIAVPQHLARRSSVDAYAARLTDSRERVRALQLEADGLKADLDRVQREVDEPTARALLAQAAETLESARGRIGRLVAELDSDPDPEAYPDETERLDAHVTDRKSKIAAIAADLGAVRGQVRAVGRLRDLASTLDRTLAKLEGVEVDSAARKQIDEHSSAARAAIEVQDLDGAHAKLEDLERLVDVVSDEWELRIVTREGQRSGVWRYHTTQKGVRNYYLVVEAVGTDGRTRSQWITSEEDGSSRRVRTWAIRVPKARYEQVKADKLDNGIIDERIVGRKRRGALEPEYVIEVAGGAITRW